MLDEPVRYLTSGREPPIAGQQPFAIGDDLERHRGERDDREQQPGEAESERPSLVHPYEDRGRGVAQEDESVDASGDRDEVGDIERAENECRDETGPGENLGEAKLRKSKRGLRVRGFSVVVMKNEPLVLTG